jgi:cytochrome P450
MRHRFSDVSAFRRDPLQFLLQRGNGTTEALAALNLGFRPVFLVTDPELIKPLLKVNEADANKGRIMQKLRPILGNSSLLIGGDEHRRRREVLHEHLARGQAERYLPQMTAEIRALGVQLLRHGRFDPHHVTAPLALRIICITVFGRQVISAGDEQALVAAVNSIEDDVADEMFRVFPLSPWAWMARRRRRAFAKIAMSFVIDKLRREAAATSALKALEELGISSDDVRDEILTLLLAGHHTTGSTAAWLLYHLAAEPGLMDKIAKEAAAASDENGEISSEGLKQATLSQALVREVLRLYPATWWFSREVRRPITLGKYHLKPGTSLIISPWQMQRDPRQWDAPDQFRLDRNYTSRAYLPFGAGPRACVGMGVAMLELQVLALEMAAAYQFGAVHPLPAPSPKASVTMIPPEMSIEIRLRDDPHSARSAA